MEKKILLVDDHDITIQTQIQLWRYYYGIQPDYAKSAEEALVKTKKNNYDLIIADVEMTKIQGSDMVAYLRNNNIDVPIIMLSAHRETDTVTRCIQAGANDYLIKPINNEVYFKKICRYLEIDLPDEFQGKFTNNETE